MIVRSARDAHRRIRRPAPGGAWADLHRGLSATHVRLPHLSTDAGRCDRRVRGWLGILRPVFAVDPDRIRSPRDKPRVERCVAHVRSNFLAGGQFRDLDNCRARAEHWCGEVAGCGCTAPPDAWPTTGLIGDGPTAVGRLRARWRRSPRPIGVCDLPVPAGPMIARFACPRTHSMLFRLFR